MSAGGKGNRTRKTLSFFRVNFGHAPPYEVLCDGPTIFQSLKNDLYLKQSLPKLLGGTAYPVVTQCVVKELRTLGDDYSNAALFARRLKRVSCVHEGKTSVAECLTSVLRNPSEIKFVLATTDPDVIARVTRIPGIPIISIMNQKKLLLKAPSLANLKFVKESEKKKSQSLSEPDRALIDRVKAAEEQSLEERMIRKKRKRAKGPNPLSVKKSKVSREKSDGNMSQLSLLLSRSTKSPGDNSLLLNKRNDKIDQPMSKTRKDQVQIKVPQGKTHAVDASKEEAKTKRIRGESIDGYEIPDHGTNIGIKDMDETEKNSSSKACAKSKSSRKRRRKNQKEKDDTAVHHMADAAETSADLSRNTNSRSMGLREDRSLNLKDTQSSVVGESQQQIVKHMPISKAECTERMSQEDGDVMHVEGVANGGRAQSLVHRRSTPTIKEPESREGNVTENLHIKTDTSGIVQHDKDDGLRDKIEGCKGIVCHADNTQLTTMGEIPGTVEDDIATKSAGMDGKRKKKQRKNRRRRPKKMGPT